MKTALVVPSCRASSLGPFLEAWGREPVSEIIVVEDGPERTFDARGALHVSWSEIEDEFGPDAWVFSRRDSAIRSAGFALAYRRGADVILTLDDDCFPERSPGKWLEGHLRALRGPHRWASTIPGMRVRGMPYRELGTCPAYLNVGLWSHNPDLDAVTTLSAGQPATFDPPRGSWILPAAQLHPVCGMNLAFRREFTPLAYFALMGEGYPFRRFDDIWFGLWAQLACKRLGWPIACGDPIVRHARASDPFANLVKEAPGVGANETFWRRLDAVALTATTAAGCMAEFGAALAGDPDPYFATLGAALRAWARLFEPGAAELPAPAPVLADLVAGDVGPVGPGLPA
jgi:reversibly glycosylated polypeptide/UDP-arabinopyranose mutase